MGRTPKGWTDREGVRTPPKIAMIGIMIDIVTIIAIIIIIIVYIMICIYVYVYMYIFVIRSMRVNLMKIQ